MAGVTQRTVYRLRRDVDEKLGRLPLKYFDSHPRGDILSRVTNDIDNIGQTLQQSLTQLITSVLTVIGVLVMMFLISPLLAVISLLAVPLSIVVTIAHRQALAEAVRRPVGIDRHAQRPRRGDAHRPRDREGLRPPGGGDGQLRRPRTRSSTTRATGPSSSPGIIQPSMNFIANLNYVAIAVIGGLQVASGADDAGRRAGVHPVLAPVHLPDHPDGEHRQRPPVGGRLRRAGLRAARRARGDRPTRSPPILIEQAAGQRRVRGRLVPLPAGRAARSTT